MSETEIIKSLEKQLAKSMENIHNISHGLTGKELAMSNAFIGQLKAEINRRKNFLSTQQTTNKTPC